MMNKTGILTHQQLDSSDREGMLQVLPHSSVRKHLVRYILQWKGQPIVYKKKKQTRLKVNWKRKECERRKVNPIQ